MASNTSTTPDLASILKTLSDLNSQNARNSQNHITPQRSTTPSQEVPPHLQQAWQQELERASYSPRTSAPTDTQPKAIDPASIIDWSSGLRCVMKTVAKHDNIINEIRRMIKVQNEHEEQWWQGRNALIEKQKGREEGQRKLDEVLKAIGGAISTMPVNNTPEELARELETYDMKVHRAQMQMVREFSTRLKGYGVPFFGTKVELVRPDRKKPDGARDVSSGKEASGMIDELELVKLQRKMLGFLEDLCSE